MTHTFKIRYANVLVGSLVLLVLALLAGQATGILYLSVWTGMLIGLVLLLIDGVLMYYAIRTFNRDRLLASAA